MNDLIGVYEKIFSESFCSNIIDFFNYHRSNYVSFYHDSSEPTASLSICQLDIKQLAEEFHDVFWNDCYEQYRLQYNILNLMQTHDIKSNIDITKMSANDSLSAEIDNIENSDTVLKFRVYLDSPVGGDIEFLSQDLRIQPKTGTCIIFPSYFTHRIKENFPQIGCKYFISGRINY